jgi:hypothetical protein
MSSSPQNNFTLSENSLPGKSAGNWDGIKKKKSQTQGFSPKKSLGIDCLVSS